METIIGLLFILLPVILKLIGKKLEQSGKTDASETLREIVESMGEDNDESPIVEWLKEKPKATAVQPVPRPEAKQNPKENVKPVVKKPKPRTPILVEEEKKKGEKIDPKKLVIYSEIMKPKFTE
ncbi:MAG: hypothetical protein IKY66_10945 [Bacteroidales bacterium]|nr:hypothetical protein [Bacteroidales bacterium]